MDSHRSDIRPQETDIRPQETDIILIDHLLYMAAARGQTSKFEPEKDRLHRLLTRGGNTVLHIHLKNRLLRAEKQKSTKFGLEILSKMFPALNNTEGDNDPDTKSANFLKKILEMRPTLLKQQNHVGENPLHVAAKYGDLFAVKLLIDQCDKSNIGSSVDHHVDSESGFCGVSKQMLLRMKNNAGDTALHESMGQLNDKVAKILCEEDKKVMYDRNAAGETPLYLAVKARFYDVVRKGLENMDAQSTSAYNGCSDGKTILHEAVISDFLEIDVILEKRKELCRVADVEKGWVPLHYAANLGKRHAIKALLECDPFAAGIKDKNGQIPLLVIADPKICRSFIREIMSWSPDCCELEMVDEKFYHDDRTSATEFNKITKQDRRNITYFGCNSMEFEEETKHAFKVWTKTFNDGKEPDEEKMLDKESTLVVAALIATVTFAAGFTLPGGYVSGGDNLPGSQPAAAGSAVLSKNAAFKAFLMTDAIAMALSSCAVFIHMFLALKKDRTKDSSYFLLAFKLIIVAMVVMVVAFMTGIYAVLGSSNAFAIASCVFISVSFLLCILNLTFGYFTDYVYSFLHYCVSHGFLFLVFCLLAPFFMMLCFPIFKLTDYYDDYKNSRGRRQSDKDSQPKNSNENTEQEGDPHPKSNNSRNLETLPESNVNPRTPSINEESVKSSKIANDLEAEKGDDAV